MSRAVFLDRDGTINADRGFVHKASDFRLLPNAVRGLKRMQELGYRLIIITNQSGIGMGYYTENDYKSLMKEIYARLRRHGVAITDDFFCPHDREKNCGCRKPGTLLVKRAAVKHGINLKESVFIGDKTSDILTGKKSGMKTILVLTGKAGKDGLHRVKPDFVCRNLYEAGRIIQKSGYSYTKPCAERCLERYLK